MIIEKDGLTAEGSYSLYYAETDGNCTAQAPNTEVFGTHISRAGVQHYLTESPVTRPVELNKWYYVVSTYDGTTQRLYVNGQLRASQNTNTNPFGTLSTAPLYIGRSHQLNTWAVNGVIDDVKIYNVPLTAGQVFNEYVNDLKRPGSGNAVLFDPNLIQAINVGTGFDQTGSFSFETWVKRTNTNVTDLNAQTFMASQLNNGWSIGINQSSPQNRIYLSKVGVSQVVSASSITDTKWHHVAVTYNATTNQVIFYIDGVADAPVSYNPGGFNSGNSTYRIGGRNNGPSFDNSLNGSLDEVRVWNNVVLSQSVIRDWMCRKITSVHPHYSSLYGYFQLNEGSGTTTGGYNGFFGTFENGPIWQTSGAALGDDAVHDFVNVTKTASISHTTGENFTVTSTSGSPAGIVVYRVDEKPNSISGANSSTNNKYFGVFQSGGSSPQYTAVYNYTGNPLVTVANEPLLRLAKRADNSVTTWTQTTALPNEPANTITLTGESTEYILGQLGSPLPVTLLSFAASRCGNNVCLLWTVENEVNFSHYEVEKSTSLSNFTVIANTTARNSSARSNYTSTDLNPAGGDNFYRLKMVNLDGSFTYSKIIRINFAKTATVSLQPNPASEFVILKGLEGYQQYRIVDATGKIHLQQNIQAPVEEIDISRLSKGLYYIQLTNKNQVTSLKLVKQ